MTDNCFVHELHPCEFNPNGIYTITNKCTGEQYTNECTNTLSQIGKSNNVTNSQLLTKSLPPFAKLINTTTNTTNNSCLKYNLEECLYNGCQTYTINNTCDGSSHKTQCPSQYCTANNVSSGMSSKNIIDIVFPKLPTISLKMGETAPLIKCYKHSINACKKGDCSLASKNKYFITDTCNNIVYTAPCKQEFCSNDEAHIETDVLPENSVRYIESTVVDNVTPSTNANSNKKIYIIVGVIVGIIVLIVIGIIIYFLI